MKTKTVISSRFNLLCITAIQVLCVSLHARTAAAADNNWTCGTNQWGNSSCWSAGAVPTDGENVILTYNPGNPIGYVDYINPSNPTLESVLIDTTNGTTWLTLSQGQDALTTNYLTVGNSIYSLSGTGSLVVNNTFVLGTYNFSKGFFYQSGGSVSVNGGYGALTLGRDNGSEGKYALTDGNLTLLGGSEEIIGDAGYGEINQSGGIHEINGVMYLGNQNTSYGKYTMTGGELNQGADGGDIVVAEWGAAGWFDHSNGTVHVNNLALARQADSTGYYNLTGMSELITNTTVIGNRGYATFRQDAGTHTASSITLASDSSGSGTYSLLDGTVNAGLLQVGENGIGLFEQYGGTHNASSIWLGMSGGGLQNSNGTYNFHQGIINSGDVSVGIYGYGEFNQHDGIHNVASNLIVAEGPESAEGIPTRYGYYNFHNGVLNVGGNTIVGNGNSFFSGEPGGRGEFFHDGGTHTADSLILGGAGSEGSGTGYYSLSNQPSEEGTIEGELNTASTIVGEGGGGYFSQTAGIHTTNSLIIAENPGSTGTYNMEGGTLNADTVVNNYIFNFQGGTANIANSFDNYGTFSGSGTGVFNGNISNYGLVSPGDSPGYFAVNGDYTQDPDGSLYMELAGYAQGSEYDFLSIAGAAALDGELSVNLLDSFMPVSGSTFSILEAANGVSGTFNALSLPPLGSGLGWQVAYGSNNVNLVVTPEPLSMTLFLLGGLPIAASLRRKRRKGKA